MKEISQAVTYNYVLLLFLTATLKDVEGNEILIKERNDQLEERRKQYQWEPFPDTGLPSAINDTVDDIPPDEEFSRVKTVDFTANILKTTIAVKKAGIIVTINSLEDYVDLAKYVNQGVLPLQKAGRWTSDVEFGRQILNGVNPVVITRCTSIPDNFPITNNMVKPFLSRGLPLNHEIQVS